MSKFRKEICKIYVGVGRTNPIAIYKSKFHSIESDKAFFSKEKFFTAIHNTINLNKIKDVPITIIVYCVDKCFAYLLLDKEERKEHKNSEELLNYIVKEFIDNGLKIFQNNNVNYLYDIQTGEHVLINI